MNCLPRILYVLHDDMNNVGGTEQHTRVLFDNLKDSYDTWVIYPNDNKVYVSNDGKQAMPLPGEAVNPFAPSYCSAVIDSTFSSILQNIRPDIIHVQHFIRWPLNIVDLSIQSGVPTVLSIHDYYTITPEYIMYGERDPSEPLTPENSIKRYGEDISGYLRERRKILTGSLHQVSRLIVPSEFVRRRINSVFPNEFTVIPHGIPSFPVVNKTTSDENIIFGYTGKLIPSKGWKQLVDAFSALKVRYPNTELHMYGEIQSEYELQQADDQSSCCPGEGIPGVVFHGRYAQSDLSRIFSEIDVLVIPSLTAETFSLVLSEAWMAGLPVAVSDIGALGERVTDNVNGKKFRVGNVDSIKDTLAWFIEDNSWKNWKISRPGTTAEMLAEYDSLYGSLID